MKYYCPMCNSTNVIVIETDELCNGAQYTLYNLTCNECGCKEDYDDTEVYYIKNSKESRDELLNELNTALEDIKKLVDSFSEEETRNELNKIYKN